MLNFSLDKRYIHIYQIAPNNWQINEDANSKPFYKDCSCALGTLRDINSYLEIIGASQDDGLFKKVQQHAQYVTDHYIAKLGWIGRIYNCVKRFFGFKADQDEIVDLNKQIQGCYAFPALYKSNKSTLATLKNVKDHIYLIRENNNEELLRNAKQHAQSITDYYMVQLDWTGRIYNYVKRFFGFKIDDEIVNLNKQIQGCQVISKTFPNSFPIELFDLILSELSPEDLAHLDQTSKSCHKMFRKWIYIHAQKNGYQDADNYGKILSYAKSFDDFYFILNSEDNPEISNNFLKYMLVIEPDIIQIDEKRSKNFIPSVEFLLNDCNLSNSTHRKLYKFLIYLLPISELEEKAYLHKVILESLSATSSKNALEIAQCLIERGVNINALDAGKVTPLECAIKENKSLKVIQWLLDNGADPKIGQSLYGFYSDWLCSSLALDEGKKVIQLLVENGADINAFYSACYKWTLLELASIMQSICSETIHLDLKEKIQILIDLGADPKIGRPLPLLYDPKSWNLTSDINKINKEIAQLLVENGADINAPNVWERTVLEEAARAQDKEALQFFLDLGAADPKLS